MDGMVDWQNKNDQGISHVDQESADEYNENENTLLSTGNVGSNISPNINSADALVKYLIDEICEMSKREILDHKARENMKFYRIVRGGNVKAVRSVLEQLKNNGFKRELAWAVGDIIIQNKTNTWLKFLNILCYIFYVLLFLALTPIYYFCHAATHSLYEQFQRKMISNINLPLVFTLLSEKKSMVKLFIEYGCQLSSHDVNGNNIFHYLAELSYFKPQKAIRCYQLLRSCTPDLSTLDQALMLQKNYLSLTGFEAIGKYGSFQYLHHILEAHGCIGQRILEVGDNYIWAETPTASFDIKLDSNSIAEDDSDEPNLKIWQFDVNTYERGDIFGKQSYLLHLVTGRSVDILPQKDAQAIIQSRILGKWMQTKRKRYMYICLLSHLICLAITALFLVYLLYQGGDMNAAPLAAVYYSQLLQQMESTNQSDINDTQIVADLHESCKKQLTESELIDNIMGSNLDYVHYFKHNSMIQLLLVLLVLQLLHDILTRQVFLWKTYNFKAQSPIQGIVSTFYRWIPGSYAEKQLTVVVCVIYLIAYYYNYHVAIITDTFYAHSDKLLELNQSLSSYHREYYEIVTHGQLILKNLTSAQSIMSNLFMTCLLLRFLLTIHAMRLLPGIGFFVITTKKMCRHILQFGAVFLFVLLAFASIFHFVLRDPDCPALKIGGFQNIEDSMFTTYKLALGQLETDVFSTNINAMIGYIVCTVFIIIMLLNLIIAVMTTTATDMNQMPWKKAVCVVEMWDELLGVEANILVLIRLIWPIKLCVKFLKKSINPTRTTPDTGKPVDEIKKQNIYTVVYSCNEEYDSSEE